MGNEAKDIQEYRRHLIQEIAKIPSREGRVAAMLEKDEPLRRQLSAKLAHQQREHVAARSRAPVELAQYQATGATPSVRKR